MFNPSKLLFFICLIMGMMMTISSTSLMGIWMGMEINLLSFIPLMINTNNLMTTEASLKYFLNQVLASLVLLFLMIFMMNNYMFISFNKMYFCFMNLITCTMLMKMGAAPFHFWLPQVMMKISWFNNLILMTVQKIAPMIILSYMMNSNFLILIISLNMIISAFSGFNQVSLQKIMAFSSINHMGWMFMGLLFNESLWMNYFIFYCIFSFTIVWLFKSLNLFFIQQTFSLKMNYLQKMVMFCSFLSLGGLPPFMGFFPKWMIIQFLIDYNIPLLVLMIFCSLIILYFYLRICYSAFLMTNYFNTWKTMIFKSNLFLLLNMFVMLFGLFFISFMFFIL